VHCTCHRYSEASTSSIMKDMENLTDCEIESLNDNEQRNNMIDFWSVLSSFRESLRSFSLGIGAVAKRGEDENEKSIISEREKGGEASIISTPDAGADSS